MTDKFFTTGKTLYKVVGETQTQWILVQLDQLGNPTIYGKFRMTKATRKLVGGGSYFREVNDPVEFLHNQAIAQQEKSEKDAQRKADWEKKLADVSAANPYLGTQYEVQRMHNSEAPATVIFWNKKGVKAHMWVVLESCEELGVWGVEKVLETNATVYMLDWGDRMTMSRPSSARGRTSQEALAKLIAGCYWD